MIIPLTLGGRAIERERQWGSRKPVSDAGSPGDGLPIVGNTKPTIQVSCKPNFQA